MSLFLDSEIPTAPSLGPSAVRDRLAATLAKIYTTHTQDQRDTALAMALSAFFASGLEISDRGRVADFKAALADWLRLAADNEACGEESVDFEELRTRTRRLIGGKS